MPLWRRASKWPVATGFGAALALLIFVTPGAEELTEWQRANPWSEPWRLATSHFAHFSAKHFYYDWIVFVALGLTCETRWPSRTRWALALAAVCIPLVVAFHATLLDSYRGLSGLDSALITLLAFGLRFEPGFEGLRWRVLPWLVCAGMGAKVFFEIQTQGTVFVRESVLFVPVPGAHLVGALVGCVMALGARGVGCEVVKAEIRCRTPL